MAIYYRSSGLTWRQYMQANSFVQDITGEIKRSGEGIRAEVSEQTRNIVASNEALSRAFEEGLEQVSGEIAELRAAFNYNMGLVLEQLRIQQRTLESILDRLDAIHETLEHPMLTQARELSELGIERMQRGLLEEGLDALLESAEKNETDFIVQLQIGKLYLYGQNETDNVIDLQKAEKHLRLAARYAKSEIQQMSEAAKYCGEAFLHAAISCYAQANEEWLENDADAAKDKTYQALELSKNATEVYPTLAEAFYNHAKFAALLDDGETAKSSLKKAIQADRNYCIKADADKDFDGVRGYIRDLFESLRQQAKNEATKALESVKKLLEGWVYQSSEAKQAEAEIRKLFGQAETLYRKDTYFDYLDALSLSKKTQAVFVEIPPTVEFTTLTGCQPVSFSPDGKYLASGGYDYTVKIWNTDEFKEIATLKGHSDRVLSVTFSPDSRYLASGSKGYTVVRIYQMDGFKEIAMLEYPDPDSVVSVAFSPEGRYLASGSWSGTVKIWETDRFKEIVTLTEHSDSVNSVDFSPNGKYLASGSNDQTVKIWNTDEFKEIATLKGHSDRVHSVAFSPDGRYLAIGSGDVKIYQVDEFKEIATLTGRIAPSVAFSPNGKYLAIGSGDVKIYQIDGFKEIATLLDHILLPSVAFSPDGKYMAVGDFGENVKIWKKGVISQQAFEKQERRRIEVEKEVERKQKEQELREYRSKNKLCLECGEKLGFLDKLAGRQYCKQHRG